MALTLTVDERVELERRLRSLKIRAEDARRVFDAYFAGNETPFRAALATALLPDASV